MMLSGWKMLATHCPMCNSALLQRESKVQCASCNMPVLTQDQYDARENLKQNDSNSVNSSSSNNTNHSVQSPALPTANTAHDEIGNRQLTLSENIALRRKEQELELQQQSEIENQEKKQIQIQKQKQDNGRINNIISKETTKDLYDGYYSDNDNIGVTNTLEAEKKIYDLNNKKRDLISVKLGE